MMNKKQIIARGLAMVALIGWAADSHAQIIPGSGAGCSVRYQDGKYCYSGKKCSIKGCYGGPDGSTAN